MATFNVLLDSDNAGTNAFYLTSDSALGIAIAAGPAQQQQQASANFVATPQISATHKQAQQTSAAIVNWAYVTLAAPIYTGPGSVAYNGSFIGTPNPGDIVAYDPTMVTVASDGSISSNNYGITIAQYNDGTGFVPFAIIVSAWDVNPRQPQQSALSVSVAAAIGITVQQRQQSSANVAPIGGIAINPSQAQQSSIAVTEAAVISAGLNQQAQQSSITVTARSAIVAAVQQSEQGSASISTAAKIAFSAQQTQQENINVVVLPPVSVSVTAQQGEQSSLTVTVQPAIALSVTQAQQSSASVAVPVAPVIAINAQQSQQSSIAVRTAAGASISAQQGQQSTAQVLSFPRVAITPQQSQQAQVQLTNSASAPIAISPTQPQQNSIAVMAQQQFVFIGQQSQQGIFTIIPLPSQFTDFDSEGVTFDPLAFGIDPTPDTKTIYLGRDNVAQLAVLYNGDPVNLGPATRIQVGLIGTTIVIDSNDGPDLIRWDAGSNVIRFKLGLEDVPPGLYAVSLVVYDFAHPDGQAIAGSAGPLLKFDFVQDMAA